MSVWASGPDVAELACLRGAGFWPVGRVTGCAVLNFAWWRTNGFGVPTQLSVPYPQEYKLALPSRTRAYARLLYQGRRAAAKRMAAQCTALGGDGVVGVEVGVTPYPGDKRARQFTATGTADGCLPTWRSAPPAPGRAGHPGRRRAAGTTATVNWSGGPRLSPWRASRRATCCRPMLRAAGPTELSWDPRIRTLPSATWARGGAPAGTASQRLRSSEPQSRSSARPPTPRSSRPRSWACGPAQQLLISMRHHLATSAQPYFPYLAT
jgi:hypothetical protein